MIKKLYLALSVVICFFLFIPLNVFAGDSPKREYVIERELNCVAHHFQRNQPVTWQDVCYSLEEKQNQSSNRHEIINKALNRASEQLSTTTDRISYHSQEPMSVDETSLKAEESADDYQTNLKGERTQGKDDVLYHLLERNNPLTKLELGTELSWIAYREPGFIKDKGMMYGVFGEYTYRLSENQHIHSFKDAFSDTNKINMFRVDGKFSYGSVDYESEGTGSLDDIRDYMFEFRGVAGYDFPVFDASRITPYVGIGYRYLNDDSGGRKTTTGAAGYERESRYVYLPAGFEIKNDFSNGWTAGLALEYDIFLGGKQKSHLGDAIAGLNAVENEQKKGKGWRSSIKIMRRSERLDFFVEPFVRYWKIQDSEISSITYNGVAVGYGLEPENNSTEYGIQFGLQY